MGLTGPLAHPVKAPFYRMGVPHIKGTPLTHVCMSTTCKLQRAAHARPQSVQEVEANGTDGDMITNWVERGENR